MQKNLYHFRLFLPALIWMGIIFLFSHQPKDESIKYSQLAIWLLELLHIDLNDWTMGNATLVIRKAAHITEYAILCALLWRPIQTIFTQNTAFICLAISVLYACSDEFHQTFVEGRVGCVADVGVDSVGVLLVLLFFYLRKKRSNTL